MLIGDWIMTSLFWVGVLVFFIGLLFVFSPGWTIRRSNKFNRWINTKGFFDKLDTPRYMERWFYRHHYFTGLVIMIVSAYVLYVFFIGMGIDVAIGKVVAVATSDFGRWIYEKLFYIFLGANFFVFLIGIIVFVRPSLLKMIEDCANRWIGTDDKFEKLDSSIATDEFPHNPRLFGVLVVLGGIYMMYKAGIVLL